MYLTLIRFSTRHEAKHSLYNTVILDVSLQERMKQEVSVRLKNICNNNDDVY